MKKILTIQHIECEPLGLFAEAAGDLADFVYLRPYQGDTIPATLDGWNGLIILGGPMAVYEADEQPFLKDELDLLQQAIEKDFPVIGICLGSQLIAEAGGGRVYGGQAREAGWDKVTLTEAAADDALFAGLPGELPVFQLHGDTFDLPKGAVLLASSETYPNQAFRIGNRIYGLQFHVEVSAVLAKEWVGFYEDYITGAGVDVAQVLKDLTGKSAPLRPIAAQVIKKFLELC